jgi:hypothetical protein
MSKRTPSKPPHRPKIAAKAQRTAQDIVRSSGNSRKRSLGAGSTESPPKDNEPKQEPLIIENPAKALEDDFKPSMAVNESKKVLDFYPAAANVRAYQAMLLEMAQANMQFSFEFAQRLATVRSPFEFLSVIAESTNKRIAMFEKYLKEMAAFRALG